MTLPVAYLEAGLGKELAAGTQLKIAGGEAHHLNVKRLRTGQNLEIVDGKGWRAAAHLVELNSSKNPEAVLELDASPVLDPPPSPQLTLIQALAKDKRDLQAVQSACEIGATRVLPWAATRSVSRWDTPAKREKGLEKWRSLALSAMKQSRQSRLPSVDRYLEETSGIIQELVRHNTIVFVLHEETDYSPTLVSQLHELTCRRDKEVTEIAVVVGPEGGICDEELSQMKECGARTALLGSSVLRCSTAGPAALAVIQALLGDWR